MTVLVLNVGSSSVKYAAFRVVDHQLDELARGNSQRTGSLGARASADDRRAIEKVLSDVEHKFGKVTVIGHRVVHGGRQFSAPVIIDEAILQQMAGLTALAPLHQPHNLAAINVTRELRANAVQVACFDTSFHRTQPERNKRFALPEKYFSAGIERYGFHGLSYHWLTQELAKVRGSLPQRVLAYHLGAGASACAILDGASHQASMGFSTLDGLMMATRPGCVDVGVVLHLLQTGMSASELTELFYTRSGLLGVSGATGDMKTLLESTEPHGRLAVEMYCDRAAAVGAGLVAGLGGVDLVAFTGGIGENAAEIRLQIVSRLRFLGFGLDSDRSGIGTYEVTAEGSSKECWVVAANEEKIIAEAAFSLSRKAISSSTAE